MNNMKGRLLTLFLTVTSLVAFGQRPIVSGLDKYSAVVGETVFISGSSFPTNVANLNVTFGTGKAQIIAASSNQIEVLVPNTATYGPVTVTNTSNGLAGTSIRPFLLSFSGSAFDPALVTNRSTTTSKSGTYDICTCDFDGDTKTDAAVANRGSTDITLFRNLTAFGSDPTFSSTSIANGYETVSIECGDLDGDGKPDMVASTEIGSRTEHIYIYHNVGAGSISLTKVQEFRLPDFSATVPRSPRKIKMADIDADGKKDLIVGTETDNTIYVYANNSSPGSINFNSPVAITVANALNTGALEVADLNNDNLPDIVSLAFDEAGEGIEVLRNTSTPGTISFTQEAGITNSSQRINVMIADFNNDQLKEIVATSRFGNDVDIFTNESSNGSISFSNTPTTVGSITGSWGLTAGDINGDGMLDIGVAALSTNYYILENTFDGTSISFTRHTVGLNPDNRNTEMVDIDGDGKIDILTTNNTGESAVGNLSALLNKNCVVPTITPTDATFCLNNPVSLFATKTAQASYSWAVTSGNGSITNNGTEGILTVTSGTSATVQVTITANDASGCAQSSSQNFTLTGGTPPSVSTISKSTAGVVCGGDDFTLTASQNSEDEYYWIHPDGTQTTTTTNTLDISGASSESAGNYYVQTFSAGSCISARSSAFNVEVSIPPVVSIVNQGEDRFCANSDITLQVPAYDGFDYVWQLDGTNTGTNSNSLTASESGSYTVTLVDQTTSCQETSGSISVTAVALPTASFTVADEVCTDASLDFDASTSTGESTLTYSWDFGDGTSATGVAPTHTYTTAGTFNPVLTIGYSDVASCETTATSPVVVSTAPTSADIAAAMTPDPSTTDKCPEDILTLSLPTGYQSYSWTANGNVVSTTNSADISTNANQQSVDVTVDITNDIGCDVNGTVVTVSNYANSGFTFSSMDGEIINDTLELAEALREVDLTVNNGSNYEWSPADLLNTTTGASVIVYPRDRVSVLTVTGNDQSEGQCATTSEVTVISPGVIARKSFSPNGDGIGYDCWEILNSGNIDGCTVYIYDEKGSIVFKGDSPFVDDCVWNGNIDNGSKQLPAGVYYFVLKCSDGNLNQTGSILLAR